MSDPSLCRTSCSYRAARDTFGHLTEIFAVDTSGDMNNLARKILLEGKSSHSLPAGIFFRMYLPASNDV